MSEYSKRLRSILESLVGTGELIEVHSVDDEDSGYEVGSILQVSDETFTIESVLGSGRPDGFYVGDIDSIGFISRGTEYLVSRQMLKDRFGSAPNLAHKRTLPKFNGWADVIDYAKSERLLVEVTYSMSGDTETMYGFIRESSAYHFELTHVLSSGQEDGVSILDLERIDRIQFDMPMIESRTFLHKGRMGL